MPSITLTHCLPLALLVLLRYLPPAVSQLQPLPLFFSAADAERPATLPPPAPTPIIGVLHSVTSSSNNTSTTLRVPVLPTPTIPIGCTAIQWEWKLDAPPAAVDGIQYIEPTVNNDLTFAVRFDSSALQQQQAAAMPLSFTGTVRYKCPARRLNVNVGSSDQPLQHATVTTDSYHPPTSLHALPLTTTIVTATQTASVIAQLHTLPSALSERQRQLHSYDITTNEETGRHTLFNSHNALDSRVYTMNDDIFLNCPEEEYNSCSLCNEVPSDNAYHCILPQHSYLNLQRGTLRVANSVVLNGRIRLDPSTTLLLDAGYDATYYIDSRNHLLQPQALVNHGKVIVASGHLVLHSAIVGTGTLYVREGASLELSSDIRDGALQLNNSNIDVQSVGLNLEGDRDATMSSSGAPSVSSNAIIRNEGTLLFSRGWFQFASPLLSTSVGPGASTSVSVSSATMLMFQYNREPWQPTFNTHAPHIIGGQQLVNNGIIEAVDCVLLVSPIVAQGNGLWNVSQWARVELHLTARDENVLGGLPFVTAFKAVATHDAADGDIRQLDDVTEGSISLAVSRPQALNNRTNISVLNAGTILFAGGSLNLTGGYLAHGTATLIVQEHAILSLNYLDAAAAANDTAIVLDVPTPQNTAVTFPAYFMSGLTVLNQGVISLLSGQLWFAAPLKQEIRGQVRVESPQAALTFITPTTMDDSDTMATVLGPCNAAAGGISHCPSIAASAGAPTTILSGTIKLSKGVNVQTSLLTNRGTIVLDDEAMLTVMQYDQDSASASLMLNSQSRLVGTTDQPCTILHGNITSRGGSIHCSETIIGDASLDVVELPTLISGSLTLSNSSTLLHTWSGQLTSPTLYVDGSTRLAGVQSITGSLGNVTAGSAGSTATVRTLLHCSVNVNGGFADRSLTISDADNWRAKVATAANNDIVMSIALSDSGRLQLSQVARSSAVLLTRSVWLVSCIVTATLYTLF